MKVFSHSQAVEKTCKAIEAIELEDTLQEEVSIEITGDLHEYDKGTSRITGKNVYYHKWSRGLELGPIASLTMQVDTGLKLPEVIKGGADKDGHKWWIEKGVIRRMPATSSDKRELIRNIGKAYIFLYVCGVTDCHIDNFVINKGRLVCVDWETFSSAYFFKRLSNSVDKEPYYLDSNYNLSEFMLTNRITMGPNECCYGVVSNVMRWMDKMNYLDNEHRTQILLSAISEAIQSTISRENKIIEALESMHTGKSRVIIRATRVYEIILKTIQKCSTDLERDFILEYWRKRLLDSSLHCRYNYQKWLRQIVEKEIWALKNGWIPLFQSEEIIMYERHRKTLSTRVRARIRALDDKISQISINNLARSACLRFMNNVSQ